MPARTNVRNALGRSASAALAAAMAGGCAAPAAVEGERIDPIEAPRILADDDEFTAAMIVRLESAPDVVLRYTLDGAEPTITDPRYDGLIRIDRSVVLRARAFRDGVAVSQSAERRFTLLGTEVDHDGRHGVSYE